MRRFAVLLPLLVLSACSNSEPLALSIRNDAPEIQPIHNTLYSNLREPRRLIIRDAETWAGVWAEMISVGDPGTPPFVDFTKEDVIVAALGERRAAGYTISVVGITANPAGAEIIVATTVPGPTCDRAEILTTPLDAVRVGKLTGQPKFEERSSTRTCT